MNNTSAFDNLEKLGRILPENRATVQQIGKTPKLVSTEMVIETSPFPTQDFASAMQAAAAAESEHLNLMAPVSGMDPILRAKDDFNSIASQLRSVRLPDTKVSIGHEPISIPYHIKQYANDIDTEQYMKFLMLLLDKPRLYQILIHSRKANQVNTPALWFNQQVVIETKKRSVYQLHMHIPQGMDAEGQGAKHDQVVEEALKFCFGPDLSEAMKHIAGANRMSLFAVLVMISDLILEQNKAASVAVTPNSIWDEIIEEFEGEIERATLTAKEAGQA